MTNKVLYLLKFKNKQVKFSENLTLSNDGWFIQMEFSNGTAKRGAISCITKNRMSGWITYLKHQGYAEIL